MKPEIFIISGKNPQFIQSGYASYAYNLAKILTNLGYQVKIFVFGSESKIIKSQIGTIHIIGSKIFSILRYQEMAGLAILAPKLAVSIVRSLSATSRTIIWGLGPWGLSAVFLKLLFPKKIILLADYFTSIKHEFLGTLSGVTIADHGLWNKLQIFLAYGAIIQFYTIFEYFLLNLSDKVITHYYSTEKILANQFGIKTKKFIRLPYCVELENTSKVDRDTSEVKMGKPFIISVCRHDGRKGINFLLHAFAILSSRKLKYSAVIIGTGKLRNKHLQLAEKLGLKNIYQPGLVPDIKPYLKKADLFVFPSVEEGSSSLAVLEAMKAELPIVSTNVDGIPEDLENNKSALLISPKDPIALSLAIEKLLKNKALAKKLARRAYLDYQKKHGEILVKLALKNFISSLKPK